MSEWYVIRTGEEGWALTPFDENVCQNIEVEPLRPLPLEGLLEAVREAPFLSLWVDGTGEDVLWTTGQDPRLQANLLRMAVHRS